MGPQTLFAQQLHAEKYRAPGESFEEAMNRVASALTDNEKEYREFRDLLLDQRFVPAGRVQAGAGAIRKTTLFNCFVSGTIQDSFVADYGSIMARAAEAATTMRMGGGIGYDFSTLRPRGALIKKLQSKSSGPIMFMEIFDAIGRCTASAANRRGAQMGMLRVDHPDIEEFIHAKQNDDELTGFNLSIAVTDEFMNALACDGTFWLRFEGHKWREVAAVPLWEMIMRSTWDWAEPGVIFIDAINRMNNLAYCETIAATNPCGEQPLPPYGACLLGSFNLTKYTGGVRFDHHQFADDVRIAVRAMDRVNDVSLYPLEAQQWEAHTKRRMGLGVMGLANAIESFGGEYTYGSDGFLAVQRGILETLRDESYAASVELARERGAFPLFAPEYNNGEFIRTLPAELRADIRHNGIRNSHLTSIAPTGTISMTCDNISSGVEPVFALHAKRNVNMDNGKQTVDVSDYGLARFGTTGKTCDQVTVQEHLDVLVTAAELVDSSVSKTCNVPTKMPWEDFKATYVRAWERGAKGCTTYRLGGKRGAVMESAAACTYDPTTGTRTCE